MGAWGYESFENDSALDWVAELARSDNPSVLMSALAAPFTTVQKICFTRRGHPLGANAS